MTKKDLLKDVVSFLLITLSVLFLTNLTYAFMIKERKEEKKN